MIHSLRAFNHRNFRLFFYGQSLGITGYWVQQIAMAWLVYRLTGSALLLGATAFAGQAAVLVLAPFGGLWADRVDRLKLLRVMQAAAALPAFTLAALSWLDVIEVWHIILMASLLGVVIAIDAPIRQSFLPEMVGQRQDLPSAIAFNSGLYNAGRMIGPTIAGVLLAVSSEAFCFLVNGISTITMTIVDDRMRGRVAGLYSMAFLGMYPVGSLASGALASWIGATHTLALGGVSCVLCALWLWPRLPELRQHIRPIYVRLGLINE